MMRFLAHVLNAWFDTLEDLQGIIGVDLKQQLLSVSQELKQPVKEESKEQDKNFTNKGAPWKNAREALVAKSAPQSAPPIQSSPVFGKEGPNRWLSTPNGFKNVTNTPAEQLHWVKTPSGWWTEKASTLQGTPKHDE